MPVPNCLIGIEGFSGYPQGKKVQNLQNVVMLENSLPLQSEIYMMKDLVWPLMMEMVIIPFPKQGICRLQYILHEYAHMKHCKKLPVTNS